jgi:hypothetical protein
MGASASSGVKICATKPGVTGTALAPTAASKAKPAVITVADTTGMFDGQLIKLAADSTGLSTLDGKTFVVEFATGDVPGTATTFKLIGSDSTGDTGTFTAGAAMTTWAKADMQCLCFSEFSFSPETPSQISTGTYCNPQDAIASAATAAGSVSFGGYIDIKDAGYAFLLDNMGKDMDFIISFPNNGYITVPITLDTVSFDIPLDGALGFNGTGTLKASPRHVW